MVTLGTECGFEWDGIWITDPTVSECGRFEVDPITYYGLTEEEVEELIYWLLLEPRLSVIMVQ